MRLIRPSGCEFQIGDLSYRVPPPTRGQMREALALDAEAGGEETPQQVDTRRALCVAILCRFSEPPLPMELLTSEEEVQILTALMAQHHGLDPVQAVAIASALKKNAILAAVLAALRNESPISTTPPSNSASTSGAASPLPSASPTSNP